MNSPDIATILYIAGFDAPLHLSEETINARYSVPLGLVGATMLAGIMGWGEPPCMIVIAANASVCVQQTSNSD